MDACYGGWVGKKGLDLVHLSRITLKGDFDFKALHEPAEFFVLTVSQPTSSLADPLSVPPTAGVGPVHSAVASFTPLSSQSLLPEPSLRPGAAQKVA